MAVRVIEDLANNEKLHQALLSLLTFMALASIYAEIRDWQILLSPTWTRLRRTYSRLVATAHDYLSGRYYKPWEPSQPIIVVSAKKQIAEFSEAACLSQRAVYADMFGFKHTMNKYSHNDNEHQLTRTRLHSRLLQVKAPAQLEALYPHLSNQLDSSLQELSDSVSLPAAQTLRRLVSNFMSFVFFGQVLTADEEFSDALLQYPRDMVKCMAAFQVTPSVISPLVHSVLTRRGKAMRIIQSKTFDCMGPGRLTWQEPEQTKSLTIMNTLVELTEGSDYWDAELLSQSLLGIWFAASHQPWMNLHFVLLELCARQDWQTTLRQELQQNQPLDYKVLEGLPLLDAFIKETVRLNPLDTLAIRRKALEPYDFSDHSLSVPAGATVCVSAYDLMHDSRTYAEPDAFDPTRFLPRKDSSTTQQQRKFVEVSESFPVWGYGSLACPGRFHASLAMKMVLSGILLAFDIRLEDPKARTKWHWETFAMPYESTKVIFKRRT
ncbi:cytochrome P450 [Apiospora arundinis]